MFAHINEGANFVIDFYLVWFGSFLLFGKEKCYGSLEGIIASTLHGFGLAFPGRLHVSVMDSFV